MRNLLTYFLFNVLFTTLVCGQANNLPTIIPDDYSVTNDMLADKIPNSSHKIKRGEIYSFDKAWFTNDTLKQTLVFELYTDYHRLYIFHFYNDDIPNELINKMEFDISKSKNENVFDTATLQQKQTNFKDFINLSNRINQSYFTTKKGFKLGDKKEKAINVYGKPDKCSTSNNIEKCVWKYEGDYIESEETPHKAKTNRPFAKNSFGYTVTMFFRTEKLIAIIINNDIP